MTSDKRNVRYRILRGCALQSRKVQYVLRRVENAVERWTGSLLNGALRNAEKEALSIDLYDASFRAQNDHDGLYAWETHWFARRLPSPPGSILIGAAGSGREAVALRDLGYHVHAFEPSTSAFQCCQRALGSDLVDQASYQDLVASVLHGTNTPLQLKPEARFDAVLLGWGSFGHVLRSADRLELLRACDHVAPNGPILLSIFEPKVKAARNGTYYMPWGGFLVRPTTEELGEHAKSLNRELVVSLQSPSSYATLVPKILR
ncbi:MAG: hypothetical protein WBN70_12870 [Polyangiales bacterium]